MITLAVAHIHTAVFPTFQVHLI